MARFDTGHGSVEDVRGDRPAVEQWFLRLHYCRLPHVHLLVTDGVQYGARGFVGLQRKVCDVRHPKGNENGRLYICIEGGRCDNYREGVELSQRRSTTEHVRFGSRCGSRCWCNASRAAPQEVSKGKVLCIFSGFCLVQVKTPVTKEVDISAIACFAAATAVATV